MLKSNDGIKFAQDIACNHVREKEKITIKILYKVLEEEDGYHPLLEIPPFPKFIQLKDYIYGIHHCVTVVGGWILTVVFLLQPLLLNTIWTIVVLMIMKKINEWLQSSIESNWVFHKIEY